MDRINIINNEVKLDESIFGIPYLKSKSTDGTLNAKYKIYKNNFGTGAFLVLIINEKGRGFRINGSIRKWWFGNRSIQDLNYNDFVDCIETIATKLQIPKTKLWDSRVTYLEIGGNVRLHRKYAFIIQSMVSFPRLQKVNYTDQTTTFKSTNRDLIIYDKIYEIYKDKSENKKNREKICENIFVMRFEIRLKTPSGTTVSEKVKTLYNIRGNWNSLIGYWVNEWGKIECLKFQKPKPTSKKEFMTRKELQNFGFALSVEVQGLDFFNNIINSSFRSNHRSQEKKNIIEICKTCKVGRLF